MNHADTYVEPILSNIRELENAINDDKTIAQANISNANEQLIFAEQKIREVESNISTTEQQIRQLESYISTAEQKISEFKADISNAKSPPDKLHQNIFELSNYIDRWNKNIETLNAKIDRWNKSIASRNVSIDGWNENIVYFRVQIDNANAIIVKTELELREFTSINNSNIQTAQKQLDSINAFKENLEKEIAEIHRQHYGLAVKPEELASVPPQVQYEGVCYAHAFARSLLRTLRVLELVKPDYNYQFYYALFTFAIIKNKNKNKDGGNLGECFMIFVDLMLGKKPYEFFDISCKKINGYKGKILTEILKNIPEMYCKDVPFLDGFDKNEFVKAFNKLYNTGAIRLLQQTYKVNMDENESNPISEEIKNALEQHLQPTISTYRHAMVLRGWGGTDNDTNTVYIKNTWELYPILVCSDLNQVSKTIQSITKSTDTLSSEVVFTWLMITDKYIPPQNTNTYFPSYVCTPPENCTLARSDVINTIVYTGKNKWYQYSNINIKVFVTLLPKR